MNAADPVAGIGGVHVQGLGRGFPLYAMAAVYGSGEQVTANFGNTAFAGAVPSGYTPGFGTGVAPPTNMAASQVALEQWSPITATQMRVTQIGVEQWGPIGHTNMTVTQVAVEQWAKPAVVNTTAQATWNADGVASAMWYGGMAPGAPPLPLPGASLNDGWVPHGYTLTISEYSPYMCGVSRVGDTIQQDVMAGGDGQHYRWELGPPEMRFIWTVHLSASPYTQFHCAIGQCGLDPEGRLLAFAVDTDLECILNRYKPAQTYIAFDYTGVST